MSLWKSKQNWITLICIGAGLFMLVTLAHVTQAKECDELSKYLPTGQKCSTSDGWDPLAELENMGTPQAGQSQAASSPNWPKVSRQYRWDQPVSAFDNSANVSTASTAETSTNAALATNQSTNKAVTPPVGEPVSYIKPKRSSSFYVMAAPLSDISKHETLLDVSSGVTKFIPGAVHVDYLDFQDNGSLKPAKDLAKVLGNAGISNNDSVLIYGDCRCGLGPSVSTYVYWIMRYLGHDPNKVKILDGGLVDWVESNHSAANETKTMPKTTYSFNLDPEFLATYDEAKSGQVRVIDARMPQDFSTDSILGSNNLPFSQFISNGRIKDETVLQKMLQGYPKNKPVVVYSNEGVEGSLVWFSLEIMGYQAKLYTWKDWNDHIN